MSIFDYPISTVELKDSGYPKHLKKIKNPPKKLYYRGELKIATEKTLAIVGSRKITRYGEAVIERFMPDLVSDGVVTVSGFMYGVDSCVHAQTVDLGGRTIAVFGCGLDVVYPPENIELYEKILDTGGLVFSEYEPKARPHLWKFPQRNRIVVGLSSLGVLVVEAAVKSGSLVTAKLAQKEKRQVFAVPGAINSSVSAGTNELIKKGRGKCVTSSADITGVKAAKTNNVSKIPEGMTEIEAKIWKALLREALSLDELSYETANDITTISTAVTNLSLKGVIRESAGKYYLM